MNTIKTIRIIRTMRTLSSIGMLMLLILLVLMNMQQHNVNVPGTLIRKDIELKQNQLSLFWHSLLTWVGW